MVGYWGLFRLPRVYELYQLVRCLVSPKMFFLKFKCTNSMHFKLFIVSTQNSSLKMSILRASAPGFIWSGGFPILTSGGHHHAQNLLIGHWWLITKFVSAKQGGFCEPLGNFRPPPETQRTFRLACNLKVNLKVSQFLFDFSLIAGVGVWRPV